MTSNGNVLNENSVPKWLSEEYFHDILSKEYQGYKIRNFSIENALGNGENYASIMCRCLIELELSDGKIKKVSYILKLAPNAESQRNLVDEMGLFIKEVEMYEKYVSKFESLYKKFGLNIKFAPKTYKLTSKLLIMEDLKSQNYKNMNRHEGLNLKQSEAILEKLAKFHAASVCINEEEGPYPENFFDGIYSEKSLGFLMKIKESSPNIFLECMSKWPIPKEYVEKMTKFYPNRFTFAIQDLKYNPNVFNVLNHGDLWSNNIMFKYDQNNQELIDLQFVDLQICKWGSPAQDLNYFIISSCSTEIKIKHFDYLIKYYHDQLISNLKLLKYSKPLPKLRDLHCEVIKFGHFAIANSIGILPIVLVDPAENAKLDNLILQNDAGKNFRKQMCLNPAYIKAMEELLPFFDNRGYFEP